MQWMRLQRRSRRPMKRSKTSEPQSRLSNRLLPRQTCFHSMLRSRLQEPESPAEDLRLLPMRSEALQILRLNPQKRSKRSLKTSSLFPRRPLIYPIEYMMLSRMNSRISNRLRKDSMSFRILLKLPSLRSKRSGI